jgi:hypothetical protein
MKVLTEKVVQTIGNCSKERFVEVMQAAEWDVFNDNACITNEDLEVLFDLIVAGENTFHCGAYILNEKFINNLINSVRCLWVDNLDFNADTQTISSNNDENIITIKNETIWAQREGANATHKFV